MSLFDLKRLLTAGFCVGLVACSSVEPVAYTGIESTSHLVPNRHEDSATVPYRYSTPVDWRTYERIIIEPVSIYAGADHQFGDMSEADKAELARYMQQRFTDRLSSRFRRVAQPSSDALRLKLTLTGATTNTPVLSTLSHFDIAGGLYNGVQAVRGRQGTFTGSVMYVVDIYDASTDRLLSAAIVKQYPGALNVAATLGSLAAAKTGIDKGADALAESLK
jgi:hypothetical protein